MLYEHLPFWISVVVAFILIVTKIDSLNSRRIKEKAATEESLMEALNELAREKADHGMKDGRYFLLKQQMKEAQRESQRIHKLLESELLDEHNMRMAALRRVKASEDENNWLGNTHAEILQKATDEFACELQAIEVDNNRLKSEKVDLEERLARTVIELKEENEKTERMHKRPGAEGRSETTRIIQDLQASLAIAGREAQDWRMEAYNVIVRKSLPSHLGLSLFNIDARHFPMPMPMSPANHPASLLLSSAVESSGHSTPVSTLAPSPPPRPTVVGPNDHSSPSSSLSTPNPKAALNPLARDFRGTSDTKYDQLDGSEK